MKGIGVPSLLLTLSLFCLLRTTTGLFSALNVADHHLETHLMEWKTLPTGERVSSPEKMHRQYMQTWKRRTAEASAQQWRAKRAAIASVSHGRKLSNGRTLVAANATTEVNALLAFRSAIATDPFGALTSWTLENGASHCSTWEGITCDEFGQVTEIELRDVELNGTISPSIGDLAHLSSLSLSGSSLWGAIPSSLGRCQNLSLLDLSHNSLSGKVPAELFTLSRLEILWLSNNAISGRLPEVVEANGCQSLTDFRIDNTEISGTLPSSLSKCRNLELVSLTNNELNGSIPAALGDLHELQELWLGSNGFSGGIPKFLGNFSSLVTLDLSNNALKDNAIALSSLNKCPKLEIFLIGQNNIYGSLPMDFTKWPSLKHFSVTNNKLSGAILVSFGSINLSLVLADFSQNKFTGTFPIEVDGSHLSKLRVLLFSHNEIEGLIPSWFGNLKSLQMLDLSFNHLIGSIPQSFGNLDGYKVQVNETSSLPDHGTDFSIDMKFLLKDTIGSKSFLYLSHFTPFIDLSSNALQGNIPVGIIELVGLKYLNLSNNRFDGNLWAAIENLMALEILDVSQNNLHGSLPPILPPSLSTFKVFLNNFSGPIPSTGLYGSYSNFDYLPGNLGLCGNLMQRPCASKNLDSLDSLRNQLIISDYISILGFGIGVIVGFCIVAMTTILWAPARVFVLGATKKKRAIAKVQPVYGLFRPRN